MPDKKISQLTSLAQGDIATTTDVLAIVDTSATETKKATPAAIVGAAAAAGLTSVDINSGAIDGTTIGANSAAAGTFTNLTASGTVSFSGATVSNGGSVTTIDINGGTIDGASIGASSASSGAFTTLSASGSVTLSGGTANGVLYLNGSKVATSGSALTFSGSVLATTGRFEGGANLGLLLNNTTGAYAAWQYNGTNVGEIGTANQLIGGGGTDDFAINTRQAAGDIVFGINTSESMRLTSTGLGIGTASPAAKLQVAGAIRSSSSVTGPLANVFTSATNPASTGASGNGLNLGYDNNGEVAWIQANRNSISETRPLLINPNGGSVAAGTPSLSTGTTSGFLYVPTCAGTPTGTPNAITGMAPIVVDTTNNKLYFYSTGVWRDAGP